MLELLLLALEPVHREPRLPQLLGQRLARRLGIHLEDLEESDES